MTTPIGIGSRRELFVDDVLIDEMRGCSLQLARPERREVVFTADAPWEDWAFFGNSVVQEGGRVRLYYRAGIPDLRNESVSASALAESTDGGYSFTRPELGLVEFRGSRHNNLLHAGPSPGVPPVFLDTNPACPPDQRYKGFDLEWKKLYAMASPDGLRWRTLEPAPLEMRGTFDTVNTGFWDPTIGRYRSYTRFFDEVHKPPGNTMGARAIQTATSEDFLNWSEPVPLEYADGDYLQQLYTNSITPCPGAPHIYLGFPNRFTEDRSKPLDGGAAPEWPGMNDSLFMSSRDGVHWNRWRDAWVRPGPDPRNWTQRNNYTTWGIIESSPTEWSILISEHYMQPDRAPGRLRRLSIRPWGFVSVHAGYGDAEAEMLTKPLTFDGPRLHLNFATSAAGSVRVEMLDAGGQVLSGYAMSDKSTMFGDELDAPVEWGGGENLTQQIGRPVRLRFLLRDADLYSIRFG